MKKYKLFIGLMLSIASTSFGKECQNELKNKMMEHFTKDISLNISYPDGHGPGAYPRPRDFSRFINETNLKKRLTTIIEQDVEQIKCEEISVTQLEDRNKGTYKQYIVQLKLPLEDVQVNLSAAIQEAFSDMTETAKECFAKYQSSGCLFHPLYGYDRIEPLIVTLSTKMATMATGFKLVEKVKNKIKNDDYFIFPYTAYYYDSKEEFTMFRQKINFEILVNLRRDAGDNWLMTQ